MSLLKPLLWLAVLVALLAAIAVFSADYHPGTPLGVPVPTYITTHPDVPPPITPEEQAMLATGKSASLLISYTDQGFSPATATIKQGDTVRFFNSSSENLWIAATGEGGAVYPSSGSGNDCGQSAFDTCRIIAPQHAWEFTFNAKGTWSYQNNADTSMKGVVIVQ